MKINISKRLNLYTQGQRFAARVLFIAWLLGSGSPQSTLADGISRSRMVQWVTVGALLVSGSVSSNPLDQCIVGADRSSCTAEQLLPETVQDSLGVVNLRSIRNVKGNAREALDAAKVDVEKVQDLIQESSKKVQKTLEAMTLAESFLIDAQRAREDARRKFPIPLLDDDTIATALEELHSIMRALRPLQHI